MCDVTLLPRSNSLMISNIAELIKLQKYDEVESMFVNNVDNINNLSMNSSEFIHDVISPYLTEITFQTLPQTYDCVDELLKLISTHAPPNEVVLELLAMLEQEPESRNVFISILRSLQITLLRIDDKPRAFQWCFNAIKERLLALPLRDCSNMDCDNADNDLLLEQDEIVQNMIIHYIAVEMFYDGLLHDIVKKDESQNADKVRRTFRSISLSKRNEITCFLISLVGKPLSCLYIEKSEPDKKANLTPQKKELSSVATSLFKISHTISQCIDDPIYLVQFLEARIRWTIKSERIAYLNEDCLPIHALTFYIYLILIDDGKRFEIPKVYHELYVFETGLYICTELLEQIELPLQTCGVALMKKLLDKLLLFDNIPSYLLDLDVYQRFYLNLCNVMIYSKWARLRCDCYNIFRKCLLKTDDEGKYLSILNLLRYLEQKSIKSITYTLYKDIIADNMRNRRNNELSLFLVKTNVRTILLNHVCALPHGVTTNLLECADEVISALNVLLFFAIRDIENETGFWDLCNDIEEHYLKPIKIGLDLSIAHTNEKRRCIERGECDAEKCDDKEYAKFHVSVLNSSEELSPQNLPKDKQLEIIGQNLVTFDLITSLLARARLYLETRPKGK